jgi:tetratricopeptide (TPR) repeat protein
MLALVAATAVAVGVATSTQAREVYGLSGADLGLYVGSSLLESWRVVEARKLVDRLVAENPEDPQVQALQARVLFFEGRYAQSLEVLEALGVEGRFRDLVRDTVEAAAGFKSTASAHFEVFWDNPKDEVMVGPALEALEAAYAALERDLGFVPEKKVRVEIYPTAAAFTSVSTLTREEVETSGTIGLCKFDRIMLTSPRATLWGYRWRDTLCHEYVHLALYRITEGAAPIWVHEGIAKYLEKSWVGVYGEIEVSGQALLAKRLEEGTLISLEQMSPSVAKLPSAEDTSLAFAEVGTMMGFLVERKGADALRRLAEGIGEGLSDRAALERVWGEGFGTFEEGWRQWVQQLPLTREDIQVIGMQLADGHGEEESPGEIRDPRAGDYTRLGDLLRSRGRVAAAGAEYAKAYAVAPKAPGIASKHALGLLEAGRYGDALQVADAALSLYPDLAVLWYSKGEAIFGLERHAEARETLTEILEINPFHLPARRGILAVAEREGDAEAVEEQRWVLELLGAEGVGH